MAADPAGFSRPAARSSHMAAPQPSFPCQGHASCKPVDCPVPKTSCFPLGVYLAPRRPGWNSPIDWDHCFGKTLESYGHQCRPYCYPSCGRVLF